MDDFLADINMTPFVDIVLVLLVIFMITAPMMESFFDVNLPATKTEPTPPQTNHFEVCTINANGQIAFHQQEFRLVEQLDAFLAKMSMRKGTPVFVRADTNVKYGLVSAILAIFKNHGIENVSLVTRYEP